MDLDTFVQVGVVVNLVVWAFVAGFGLGIWHERRNS